jgi:hypothetical protein
MSIQFSCPSCDQPIEIDDQWASQMVACPFCRKTVAAPSGSTFVPPPDIPTASPAGAAVAMRSDGRNTVAVVSLILAGLYLVALVFGIVVGTQGVLDALGPDVTPPDVQKYINGLVESGETPPSWLVSMSMSLVASALLWTSSLVCGIIGVTRVNRKPAVIALFLLTIGPLVFCAGLIGG